MMIYAVIGTNTQTIIGNGVSYTPAENEILMQSERPRADSIALADGTWQTISDIDKAKQKKITEFKIKRDNEEITDIKYNENIYDYDDKARERMRIAREALQDSGVEGGASIVWTTADNQRVTLTVQDFARINSEAAYRSNWLHVKYNELKEAVNACTTIEQVEAITWENYYV